MTHETLDAITMASEMKFKKIRLEAISDVVDQDKPNVIRSMHSTCSSIKIRQDIREN